MSNSLLVRHFLKRCVQVGAGVPISSASDHDDQLDRYPEFQELVDSVCRACSSSEEEEEILTVAEEDVDSFLDEICDDTTTTTEILLGTCGLLAVRECSSSSKEAAVTDEERLKIVDRIARAFLRSCESKKSSKKKGRGKFVDNASRIIDWINARAISQKKK